MIKTIFHQNEPYLVVDEEAIDRDKVKILNYPNEFTFNVLSNQVAAVITRTPFRDIRLELEEEDMVSIKISSPWKLGFKQNIYLHKEKIEEEFILSIDFSWDIEKWKNIFSAEELLSKLRKWALGSSGSSWIADIDGFQVDFICAADANQDNIDNYLTLVNRMMENAIVQLLNDNKEGMLTTIFDFPKHVRVPCEQYLIYFAEFLKDIGVKATTEITHEAGSVLFTVVPDSREIALSSIQEALELYLQLPSILNDMAYMNYPSEPQNQQLMANVQHFKSQIMLLNATIQLQSQTIGQQQIMIDQQKRLLDASILQTSLIAESISQEEEDKEEIFGGAMSLTKLEGKGFEVNIANIYRWLKQRLNN
ncbi:hypothetical protein C2I06_12520 [Niallia circulans]|uniref:hypothetical protein n=1 Tax=Niallia circulans TaxID=1397 RepID=UPI000F45DE21|nr:hypothetical protein [Niallia circulans]AYV67625.1 hypothetical protein C2I06_12520 [Niallia circulans]